MKRSTACLTVALCALASAPQLAAEVLFPPSSESAPPLELTLKMPLKPLLRAKPSETPTVDGEITDNHGNVLSVKIRPRGKSRRTQCDFPPLRLNFKTKKTAGTLFDGQDKLKLVTHCANKYAKRDFLAREMLVYRLLNVLTDVSFRVRAVQMNYVDEPRERSELHSAFLIEHKQALAQRLDGQVLDTKTVSMTDLDGQYATLVGLFQYMVGNTDYSVLRGPAEECCHNTVPIEVASGVLSVPYDFDATGLVNAPYAAPAANLSIRRVSQRLYRGYCDHNEILPQTIDALLSHESDLMQTVSDFDDIPGLNVAKTQKYLQRFFTGLKKDGGVQLLKRCR